MNITILIMFVRMSLIKFLALKLIRLFILSKEYRYLLRYLIIMSIMPFSLSL